MTNTYCRGAQSEKLGERPSVGAGKGVVCRGVCTLVREESCMSNASTRLHVQVAADVLVSLMARKGVTRLPHHPLTPAVLGSVLTHNDWE